MKQVDEQVHEHLNKQLVITLKYFILQAKKPFYMKFCVYWKGEYKD